jgi:hypothetical protein
MQITKLGTLLHATKTAPPRICKEEEKVKQEGTM